MALLNVKPIAPLRHDVPIVDKEGKPTPQFIRQWAAAREINLTTEDLTVSVDELRSLIEQAQALLAALEGRQIIAGDGLSGGGDLSADVNLAVDSTVVRESRQIIAGTGLSGGGDLSADRQIDLENVPGVAGSYGGAGQHMAITVDGQGRVTAIANA
jgi:hypothetical protein